MPWETDGFHRLRSWVADANQGLLIDAGLMDNDTNDIASGLTQLRTDGQSGSANWGGAALGTANALTITVSPVPTALAAGNRFSFIPGAANSGPATLQVGALSAAALLNGAALAGGEMQPGVAVSVVYDGTAFQIQGGVSHLTGVAAGTGLVGGGTAGNVPVSLAVPVTVPNGGLGVATVPPYSLVIGRGAAPVATVPPGNLNDVLLAKGSAADPAFGPFSGLLDSLFGSVQGSILMRGASAWTGLGPGAAGAVLSTQGAGADAVWLLATGTGTITGVTPGTGLSGGGLSGNVTLSLVTPVALNLGGTNATTAAAARTNLGAAPLAAPAFTGAVTMAGSATVAGALTDTAGRIVSTSNSGSVLPAVAVVDTATGGGTFGMWSSGGVFGLGATNGAGAPTGAAFCSFAASGAMTQSYGLTVAGNFVAQARAALMEVDFGASQASRTGYVDGSTGTASFNGTLTVGNTSAGGGTVAQLVAPNTQDCYLAFLGARTWLIGPQGSTSGRFLIYDSTASRYDLTIDTSGNTVLGGSLAVAGNANPTLGIVTGAAYTALWAPDGTGSASGIFVGTASGGGGNIFYRNAVHNFQSANAATTFATLNSQGGTINTPGGMALTLAGTANNDNYLQIVGARTWLMGPQYANGGLGRFLIYDNTAAAVRLQIDPNGTSYNTTGTWVAISDRRLKRDVEPYQRGLAAVLQLQPISFRYNGVGDTADDGTMHYGFAAEDVVGIMPELVGETTRRLHVDDDEGIVVQTVDPTRAIFACINAIKELAADVEALKAAA